MEAVIKNRHVDLGMLNRSGSNIWSRHQGLTVLIGVGVAIAAVASDTFILPAGVIGVGAAVIVRLYFLQFHRKTPSSTFIVVGDSAESIVISSILSSVFHSTKTIVCEQTLDDAVTRCATAVSPIIVACGVVLPPVPSLTIAGRQVPLLSGIDVIGRVLRRLPMDMVAVDPWFIDDRFRVHSGSRRYQFAKRLIDVIVAAVVGFLLLPVMMIVAGVVRLKSGGPVLIRQQYVGLNGRPFPLYVFWTGKPLLTIMGRLFCRIHRDLLPALWNVLCGDLSLAGPHPEPLVQVRDRKEKLQHYGKRHGVEPGLMSWTQVRLRYHDAPHYINQVLLCLDLQILRQVRWRWHIRPLELSRIGESTMSFSTQRIQQSA